MLLAFFVAAGLSLTMAGAWLFQRSTGNAGWGDVFWSFGTGLVGVVVALAPTGGEAWPTMRQIAVAILAGLWGLRLGLHLRSRVSHGPEDARYVSFRHEWGGQFQRRFFWFLQIQAAASVALAFTIFLAAHNPVPGLQLLDVAGIAILIIAIGGEALADFQLRRFKYDPRNKQGVCDQGLWAWSRHPNYFFEWLVWVAYALIAVDPTGHYSQGWLAFIGPALMYWLLAHVSGVPPLEAAMLRSRGDSYRAYQARTYALIPFPRRQPAHKQGN